MCDPITAITTGLSVGKSVMGFAGDQAAADANNQAVLVNAQNAELAAANAEGDQGRAFSYNMKEVQQQGYKAVMQGRESQGMAQASAGSSGFGGDSNTLGAILDNEDQKTANNLSDMRTKQDDQENSIRSEYRADWQTAKARIDSMPMKSGPSPAALGLGIAGEMFGGFTGSKTGKNWMQTNGW